MEMKNKLYDYLPPPSDSTKNRRNLGLDIYRILLACEVVFIHMCNNSGGRLLDGAMTGPLQYLIINGGLTLSYSAVNGYAILSGFLSYGHKHSPLKALLMWLCLLFYSVIEYVIIECSFGTFKLAGFLKSFLPVSTGGWWYINIYLLLIFIMPLIDKAVESLEEKKWLIASGILVGAITLSNGIFQNKDIFYVYDGYSLAWIALLYFIGAGAKKFNIASKIKKPWIWFLIWIFSVFLTWTSGLFDNFFLLFGIEFKSSVLYDYPSVTVFVSAFASLMFFASLNIQKTAPFFSKLAKGSFAAYIIHVHDSFWNHFLIGRFSSISKTMLVPLVFLIDIAFVFAASFIDIGRVALEKVLLNKIKKSEKLGKKD